MNDDNGNNSDTSQREGENQQPGEKKTVGKKRNFLFRVFRFAFFSTFVFLTTFAILLQTSFFKSWLLQIGLDYVNSNLVYPESRIYAKELSGTLFSGITLHDAGIMVNEDTLLKVKHFNIRYSIFKQRPENIQIKKIYLDTVGIYLTKFETSPDSLDWNINRIFKITPDTIPDTVETEFNWKFKVDEFVINNAHFRILAENKSGEPISTVAMNTIDTLNTDYLDITDFNLSLNGYYSPYLKEFEIKDLHFKTNSEFNLDSFYALGVFDRNSTIRELRLVTDRSNLDIDVASIEGINVIDGFDYDQFVKSNVKLKILADKFNMRDLAYFLPSLNFMDHELYLKLHASDNYSDLSIEQLDLKLRGSRIGFSGRLKNLDNPERLFIDVTGNDLTFDPGDTKYHLPGLNIPDYSHLGIAKVPFIKFTGEPLRFNTEFDLRTTVGNVNGSAFLDLNPVQPIYRADIRTTELNIGGIVQDESLNSNINGEFNADGRSFDYKSMNTKLVYSLRNTSFYKHDIKSSAGIVEINSGDIKLNLDVDATAVNARVEGNVNIRNLDAITYNLKGVSKRLNISSFTGDASTGSNLNFNFELKGTGIDPEKIAGNFKFNFQPSTFANLQIPSIALAADISNNGNQKSIELVSDVLDLKAKGRFNYLSLSNIITTNIDYLISHIIKGDYNFDSIDVAYGDTIENLFTGVTNITAKEIIPVTELAEINYTLRIKNLVPVRSYLDTSLQIVADITGSLINNQNSFRMLANTNIADLKYGDSVLIARDANMILDLNTDYNNKNSMGNVYFTSDSIVTGGILLDTLKFVLNLADSNKFIISAEKDTNISIFMDGFTEFYKNRYTLFADSLNILYNNYTLRNPLTNRISFIPDTSNQRIRFDKFKISTIDNQRVELEGFYSLNDSSNVELTANNLKLTELQKIQNPRLKKNDEINGNIRRLKLFFRNNLSNPVVYAEINTDPILVGGVPFGRLDAVIDMGNGRIEPDISFYNRNNIGNLKILGNIPYQTKYHESDTGGVSLLITQDQPVDLSVDANNFQLDILSKFIPLISNLRGSINGKLNISGNVSQPQLTGGLSVSNAVFKFDMTKMVYGFDANLKSEGQKLILTDSKLYIPEDKGKFINTTGYIDLTNLNLNDIDLEMNGTVQLLQKKYGPTGFGIYGDLYGGSGNPKLRIKGNSDKVLLSGNLVLINGNVIMDPLGASELYVYKLFEDDFDYSVNIDTASYSDSTFINLIKSFTEIPEDDLHQLDPFTRSLIDTNLLAAEDEASKSKFQVDVRINTERNIYLNFIVNKMAKNEFYGNVNADVIVRTTQGDTLSAYGMVELGQNSKYRFYKNFDATGSIEFDGPVADPTMDIEAQYRTRTSQDEYEVMIKISGRLSKLDPPKFIVYENGANISGADPSTVAMSIILFGTPQVSGSEKNQILSSIGANIGTMFVSDYVSSLIQEVLPFIVSTNINYVDSRSGNVAQNTSLDVTAEFGDATVRVGGQIFDNINNTNIIIEYPLNRLLNLKNISNNLILQVERIVDPYNSGSTALNNASRTGALIYYRIKF